MKIPDNQILVIFGASGDLTKRKLIPALYELESQKLLPDKFAILGVGRTHLDDDAFRSELSDALKEFDNPVKDDGLLNSFLKKLHYQILNTADTDSYGVLNVRLNSICNENGISPNFIFYLATPPGLYEIIAEGLAKNGLNKEINNNWRRIIVEKPFGSDLASAKRLNKILLTIFDEDQVFRIDHYLGKETVQNVMVTRFSNGIFEPLWNRNYIHHVEIT